MKQRTTERLKCPYCKAKQEYKAKDYFTQAGTLSLDIQCDSCDEKFNSYKEEGGWVTSYPNLTYYPTARA